MFWELAINFCVLFTFTVLSFWPFQKKVRLHVPFPALHPYAIGMMSGIAGVVLMQTSVGITDDIIVDARSVAIVVSGIFGGPVASFMSAALIGSARVFFYGVTPTSWIAGLHVVFEGAVIALVMLKKPMTFRNAPLYFLYVTLQTSVILMYLLGVSWGSFVNTGFYILYTAIAFFTTLFILREMNTHFIKLGQIEEMSETDFLTGLNNNRKFQETSKNLCGPGKGAFSLLLLDIDHFKKVNDTYGHPIGDEVLMELAARLQKSVLIYDGIVSRNGGEEFSILLPGMEKPEAMRLAEKVRKVVSSHPFSVTGGHMLPITVSVGIGTYPINGTDIQKLYNEADVAMYTAKETGRNRVVHIDDAKKVLPA
ncbi:MAG TPA: diguanylate cyclase [Bacillaceae bacterium]